MAREIHEREDLLRDARALAPRVQLSVFHEGRATRVFAGFRGDSLSLYFGDDPVYHFNAAGQLRRAYVGDRLLKADAGRLVAMQRERTADEVQLRSAPLSEHEHERLLDDVAGRLAGLRTALSAGLCHVEGQAPADGDAAARLAAWLASHPRPAAARSPRVD